MLLLVMSCLTHKILDRLSARALIGAMNMHSAYALSSLGVRASDLVVGGLYFIVACLDNGHGTNRVEAWL
jgi:hypothetical protein